MNLPNKMNSGLVVPPGRSLADLPKGEPVHIDENFGKPKPPNTDMTFRQYLIGKDEARSYLIPFLQSQAKLKRKPKGAPPWKEYLDFYATNQSMDMSSIKDEKLSAKCAKIFNDLSDAYLEETTSTGEE